ncbi:hypothetical protein [Candidatus Albibeggiatoa sp. nov. NOAA]|uniref:hypothetical protein n=1 Tax=Candidatus Albibeggiatoa sp. nov. NOAA TaxID=3162724 RepID=UPI0032F86C34|nr:hypothetical protein [Thiotrichaceae bacterium]
MKWLDLQKLKSLTLSDKCASNALILAIKGNQFRNYVTTGKLETSEALEIYQRRYEMNPDIVGFEALIKKLGSYEGKHVKIHSLEYNELSLFVFTDPKVKSFLGILEIKGKS